MSTTKVKGLDKQSQDVCLHMSVGSSFCFLSVTVNELRNVVLYVTFGKLSGNGVVTSAVHIALTYVNNVLVTIMITKRKI